MGTAESKSIVEPFSILARRSEESNHGEGISRSERGIQEGH